tara:strand:+ start:744 stop:884 length:141 start_codon:yes stop_codon:yes gene_type:complete
MDHFDDITCEEYYGPEITEEDMEGLYDLTDEEIADLADQDSRREFV